MFIISCTNALVYNFDNIRIWYVTIKSQKKVLIILAVPLLNIMNSCSSHCTVSEDNPDSHIFNRVAGLTLLRIPKKTLRETAKWQYIELNVQYQKKKKPKTHAKVVGLVTYQLHSNTMWFLRNCFILTLNMSINTFALRFYPLPTSTRLIKNKIFKQGIGIAEKSQDTRRDHWGGNVNHISLFVTGFMKAVPNRTLGVTT